MRHPNPWAGDHGDPEGDPDDSEFDPIRHAFHAAAMNDPVYAAAMRSAPSYQERLDARTDEQRARDERWQQANRDAGNRALRRIEGMKHGFDWRETE